MKKAVDLVMGVGAAAKEYYLYPDDASGNLIHGEDKPNVSMNASGGTPVQSGGVYDVRDTEGDKAIAHLDWVQGEGQKTLDAEDSVYSRYLEGSYIDVSTKGQFKLLRPVVNTPDPNISGPVFSAMGYVWFGLVGGGLQYNSGLGGDWEWSTAAIGGTPITTTIGGFATDGTLLYFCVPSGDSLGIWVNTATTPGSFAKFGTTGTNAAVQALAFNGGLLFAATTDGAGTVDSATGVYTKHTPAFLNVTNATVALVSAANSVHWIVSQGGRSYSYKLTYDPATTTMLTEQEAEFPAGFVATCAVGYLGNVDVGGYYESGISGVGRGAAYRIAGGMSTLLFEIGDLPESTSVPTDLSNNNRIKAACSGAKDEYFLTDRACYRWDIDDGGHSHVFDFLGAGSGARITTETGYEDVLPVGGVITTVGQYTVHTFTMSGTLYVGTHTDQDGNIISTIPSTALVTAGGGAGLFSGGGGGGVLSGAQVLTGDMAVTVGFGGADGTVGGDSIFGSRTAKGGGIGVADGVGGIGGSGGGGAKDHAGGAGTSGQGYAGGAGNSAVEGCGGGAGGVGSTSTPGVGLKSGISGVEKFYGAGGHARNVIYNGQARTVNSGDGGNGGASVWGAGSLGIVIISYLTKDAVSSTRQLSSDLFHPSVAYNRGSIFAPYAEAESALTGWTVTGVGYNDIGWLTQSHTTFHTGSMKKDFRYISIAHDALPEGSTVRPASWLIDEVYGAAEGVVYSAHETRFAIDRQGYSIETTTGITPDGSLSVSPIIRGVNVVWDFVKIPKHTYTLDCRRGAGNGRWKENPEEAIAALFQATDTLATFEDRYNGVYTGIIDKIEFKQAARSLTEGPSGIVTIIVREVA